MTTTTEPTTEGIVCPPWCEHHWENVTGGETGRYIHERAVTFSTEDGPHPLLRVSLSVGLLVDGTPGDWPLGVDLNATFLTVEDTRELAELLLDWADLLERDRGGAS